MVIYSAVLFTWGQEYLPLKNAKYGLHFTQLMIENGFRNGDNIVKVDGQPVEKLGDVVEKLLFEGKQTVTVSRGNQLIDLTLPADFGQKVLASEETRFVSVRWPFVVEDVTSGGPAAKAKMQQGDSLVGINGKQAFIFQDIATELDASRNTEIELSYIRKGQLIKSQIQLKDDGKLGVAVRPDFDFMTTKVIKYGFFESIPAGIKLGWQTLTSYVKQFKLVFTKEGSKQIGGFGSIGKMFPKAWDWQVFWTMTALLSVILAFMNFLPIPALDGGYVLFLLYELLTGKKPNDKFLEYAQTAGFFLLMGLLIYSNGNDIFKALFK
jgi:regulator of sigma E protease